MNESHNILKEVHKMSKYNYNQLKYKDMSKEELCNVLNDIRDRADDIIQKLEQHIDGAYNMFSTLKAEVKTIKHYVDLNINDNKENNAYGIFSKAIRSMTTHEMINYRRDRTYQREIRILCDFSSYSDEAILQLCNQSEK